MSAQGNDTLDKLALRPFRLEIWGIMFSVQLLGPQQGCEENSEHYIKTSYVSSASSSKESRVLFLGPDFLSLPALVCVALLFLYLIAPSASCFVSLISADY